MKMQGLLQYLKLVCVCIVSLMCAFASAKANNDEPYALDFASIEITFTKGAQRQLESLVAAYPSQVFLENISQVEAYLDLIEKQLIAEKIPTDYKYACLHRFYLQNINPQRVGFWNLEVEKALALGLKVNPQIDERFNLISTTYEVMMEIRRNNIYFKNWLINLLTLEVPFSEAKEYIREKYPRNDLVGAKKWEVNEDSHPFIREVLAFKLFMKQKIEPRFTHQTQLSVELNMQFKSLKQIAKEKNISLAALQSYNTWLKKNKIPGDKVYPILIPEPKEINTTQPVAVQITDETNLIVNPTERIPDEEFVSLVSNTTEITNDNYYSWKKNQDELRAVIAQQEKEFAQTQNTPSQTVVYPLPSAPEVAQAQTHIVIKGQTLYSIAKMYGITVQALRAYNDLDAQKTDIYPDQVLLLQPHSNPQQIKEGGNLVHFVKVGENLEGIAKAYNVSTEEIKTWNQLSSESFLEIGQKLIIYVTSQKQRIFKTHNSAPSQLRLQAPYQAQSLTQKLAKHTAQETDSEGVMRGQPQVSFRNTSHLKRPQLLWLPTIK